jgi:hypothetical protein
MSWYRYGADTQESLTNRLAIHNFYNTLYNAFYIHNLPVSDV